MEKILLKKPVKLIYRVRTDREEAYHTELLRMHDDLRNSNINNELGVIYAYVIDGTALRFCVKNGYYGDLLFNSWKHYTIALEDGYISGDLGKSGDSNARQAIIDHLEICYNKDNNDEYIDIDNIII